MGYITRGMHTRKINGELKKWMPGDAIKPTKFELVQFPNKFVLKAENSEGLSAPDASDIDLGFENLDTTKLNKLKEDLKTFIQADEYEVEVIDEAKKLLKKTPEKQHTIDALVKSIESFFAKIEATEEAVEE